MQTTTYSDDTAETTILEEDEESSEDDDDERTTVKALTIATSQLADSQEDGTTLRNIATQPDEAEHDVPTLKDNDDDMGDSDTTIVSTTEFETSFTESLVSDSSVHQTTDFKAHDRTDKIGIEDDKIKLKPEKLEELEEKLNDKDPGKEETNRVEDNIGVDKVEDTIEGDFKNH